MIPERDRIKQVMTAAEIADAMELGDYSAEMLLQHLVRRYNEERQLADRLASELEAASNYLNFETEYFEDESVLAAWKASRDQNNLEGAGPTEKERCENARAIQALTVPKRFALMFRGKEGGES